MSDEKEVKITVDDFYSYQTKIRRLIKDLEKDTNKKIILSVVRDLSKSAYRQLQYTMEVVDAEKIHIFDPNNPPQGGYAVPFSPDMPEVEAEKDPTA